jgi:hypothetical protein
LRLGHVELVGRHRRPGVAFYDLYHDGQAIGSTTAEVRTITLGVVAGVRWGFYVYARDAAGNVSQTSSTVWVTPR